ncbi:MAG: Isoquinoline 1-oxidoreductase subunit [Sulfitobacter sp.]|uniref:Isoquinoline 1-oxidoreductase subunit n=1 Tax=Alphaproteobacteria TaxID=28211 RepID=UPI002942E8A7|nr:Isoquinoline 1-oxidoreductase subunit [Sulfitobacter sp. LC.270.F.C4]WOI15224.1 Isoquinoline 1-oxidoreductase subunit [Sulfitobacter sp. LC.270.F.C4]
MNISVKLAIASILWAGAVNAETVNGLRTADEFENIENESDRSVALFEEMFLVIESPRCMNCHPVNNTPLQGDDMQPHQPPVVRGAADFGAPGMRCSTCHGAENVPYSTGEGSIPGHEPWQLAPIEMGWVGLTAAEVCEQLKDPDRNGNRTLTELHEHNAEDGLVGWGWEPGDGRTPAPGSQEVFGALTQAWIDTGAACPAG